MLVAWLPLAAICWVTELEGVCRLARRSEVRTLIGMLVQVSGLANTEAIGLTWKPGNLHFEKKRLHIISLQVCFAYWRIILQSLYKNDPKSITVHPDSDTYCINRISLSPFLLKISTGAAVANPRHYVSRNHVQLRRVGGGEACDNGLPHFQWFYQAAVVNAFKVIPVWLSLFINVYIS